jgi:hypothetical protein
MIALRVTPQYEKDRNRFKGEIDRYGRKVAKAVDLFSRIKSTDQAEEVMTVLFASRQLKRTKSDVTELDMLDYILEWKKAWRAEEKKFAVANTIRNLVLLGWLHVGISESLAA